MVKSPSAVNSAPFSALMGDVEHNSATAPPIWEPLLSHEDLRKLLDSQSHSQLVDLRQALSDLEGNLCTSIRDMLSGGRQISASTYTSESSPQFTFSPEVHVGSEGKAEEVTLKPLAPILTQEFRAHSWATRPARNAAVVKHKRSSTRSIGGYNIESNDEVESDHKQQRSYNDTRRSQNGQATDNIRRSYQRDRFYSAPLPNSWDHEQGDGQSDLVASSKAAKRSSRTLHREESPAETRLQEEATAAIPARWKADSFSSNGFHETGVAAQRGEGYLLMNGEVDRQQSEASSLAGRVRSPCHQRVYQIAEWPVFDYLSSFLVILNAMWIGYDVDAHLEGIETWVDFMFCIWFSFELSLRIFAYRRKFFNLSWNLFDLVIVVLQILDMAEAQMSGNYTSGFGTIRVLLRIVRFGRIIRLIRLVRFVGELRTILSSITGCMQCLMWTLLLLAMIIYGVAVFLRQYLIYIDYDNVSALHREMIEINFGSVPRTVLSLYAAITGGMNWINLVRPLFDGISPLMGVVVCLYISFSVFALMNVVTGVFVDRAMQNSEDDNKAMLISNLSSTFDIAEDDDFAITWESFNEKLQSEGMQDYLKAVNVHRSDAEGLFSLLDDDSSGSVNREEFISGLLRLRGNARALDLTLLIKETNRMNQCISSQMAFLVEGLSRVLPSKRASVNQ